jgi:oxygen-independent coproporphyrinogen-3 oxidase
VDWDASIERIASILPGYLGAGPRYTSYPTAPVWSDDFGTPDFRSALEAAGQRASADLSLYVHVPFCRSLCHFCACNRIVPKRDDLPASYLETLEREIGAVREALPADRPASQLHLGGGTPTYLDPGQLRRLFHALTDAFPLRDAAEVSIEVDPRVTGEAHVEALRECGFDRVSMGVQDFDPRVQEAIHRVQPFEVVSELVTRVRESGFQSVGFDLIYGLPFQTEASFDGTLDHVLALLPDRIALYSYAHVTWIAKQQRGFERKDLPDPSLKLRIMLSAIRRLLANGYVYVGMDHFARPDDELTRAFRDRTLRRNFMGYTTQAGVDLLGFGPSAISELEGCYAQSERALDPWSASVGDGGLATMRGWTLSDEDRARRWVIHRLLCLGELRADEYEQRFGAALLERYAPELERLEPMERDGLLAREPDGSLSLTLIGRILVRNVAAVFDAYLPEQQGADGPRFSQTV